MDLSKVTQLERERHSVRAARSAIPDEANISRGTPLVSTGGFN